MERITKQYLHSQVERLNRITGNPTDTAMPGNYGLSMAYGGYNLVQYSGGGQRNVFNTGHVPARLLSQLIDAYIHGVADMKHNNCK